MLCLFVLFQRYTIDKTGYYTKTLDPEEGTFFDFSLTPKESASYYLIFEDDYIDVNEESISSQVFPVSNESIRIHGGESIQFTVVCIPNSCDSMEFIHQNSNATFDFDYSKKHYELNKTYCTVLPSINSIQLSLGSYPNDIEIGYSSYDLTNLTLITEDYSQKFTDSQSLCISIKAKNENAIAKIKAEFSSSFLPCNIYNSLKLNYFTSKPINLKQLPKLRNYGIHSLLLDRNSVTTEIFEYSYVVFTDYAHIYGFAATSNSYLEILGETSITAIYFNTSGTISLHSDSTNPVPCNFIIYNLYRIPCNQIITLVRHSYSVADSWFTRQCYIFAFINGTVRLRSNRTDLELYNTIGFYYLNQPSSIDKPFLLQSNIHDFGDFEFYSDEKRFESYAIINGSQSSNKAYYITNKSYAELNSMIPVEPTFPKHDPSPGLIIRIIIGCCVLIAIIIISVVFYMRSKKKKEGPLEMQLEDTNNSPN